MEGESGEQVGGDEHATPTVTSSSGHFFPADAISADC